MPRELRRFTNLRLVLVASDARDLGTPSCLSVRLCAALKEARHFRRWARLAFFSNLRDGEAFRSAGHRVVSPALFLLLIGVLFTACEPAARSESHVYGSALGDGNVAVRARDAAEHLSKCGASVFVHRCADGSTRTHVAIHAFAQKKWIPEHMVVWSGQASDFRHILRLVNVKSVVLHGHGIDDSWFPSLSGLSDLEDLDAGGTLLSDVGVKQISHLRQLQELCLARTRITDTGLESLAVLPNLKLLLLSSTRVTDSGARRLAEIQSLSELALDSTLITDGAMTHLRRLRNLRHLSIAQTAVGDAGLREISDMPELRTLSLYNTLVSDEGVTAIAGLPSIERVVLAGSRVTVSGIERLCAARPSLKLDLRVGDTGSYRRVDRACVMLWLKKYDDALSLLQESAATDDAMAEVHKLRALAYRGLGRLQDAEQEVDRAVGLGADEPDNALLRGVILLDQHRYADAIQNCERMMAEWPRSGAVHCQRGAIHAILNEYDKAMQSYQLALQDIQYFEPCEAMLGIARLHRRRQEFEKCRAMLRTLESVALNDPATHVANGLLHLWEGNLGQAMPYFDRAVAVSPDSVRGYFDRGEAYAWAQRAADAFKDFERAIAADGTFADAYVQRGILYWRSHQLERAREDFNLALRFVGRHEEALAGLGLISAEHGQPDDGRAFFEKAVTVNRNSAMVYVLWGEAYLVEGKSERAEEKASTAIDCDPYFAEAYWVRAKAREQQGKGEAARSDRETACKLNPSLVSPHGELGCSRK